MGENNLLVISIAVVAIVAIVAVFGIVNITGLYVAPQQSTGYGRVDVCDMCFSNCAPGDELCVASCRNIPACENIGQPCGETRCQPGTTCCNPLRGICVKQGEFCIM